MNKTLKNLFQNLVNTSCKLFFIAFAFVLTSSCTNSDEEVSGFKLLTKLVEVAADNSTAITLLSYDGNKILNTESKDKLVTFVYNEDLITKIVTLNKTNQLQSTLNYTYNNGQLIKVISSDNYIMNFVHNVDGTVSYEKLTTNSQNNVILLYHGKLYFQSRNLIKDERTIDGTAANIVSKSIVSYQYDSKKNPLQNIVGYSKLLDYFKVVGANNITRTQEESRIEYLNTNQITSSDVLYVNVNQYDEQGYPTVITSEKTFFGEENTNHVKSQLFYN